MKKFTLLAVALLAVAGARAQQIQGTFDDAWQTNRPWDSSNQYYTSTLGTEYVQPKNWCISNVSGMNGLGATCVGSKITGRTGESTDYAVQLTNTANAFSKKQIVPAYITLGTSWSTSRVVITKPTNKDGGSWGGKSFTYKPDGISFYYKRSHAKKSTQPASVVAYLWKGTFSQADVPGNNTMGTPTTCTMKNRDRQVLGLSMSGCQGGATSSTDGAKCIAKINTTITGDATNWTYYSTDFTYDADDTPEMINVILAACDYFGNSDNHVADDVLCVDDVQLLYYHSLTALSYNGTSIYKEGTTSYNLSTNTYDPDLLSYTKKGVGATVESSYDESSAVLTLTVKGNDYDNNNDSKTVYTIQFKKTDKTASQLTALSYDGTPVSGFDPATFSYDFSSTPYNDDAPISYSTKSSDAKVVKSYNATTAQLTLTVTTADYNAATETGSKSIYTLQFDKPTTTAVSNSFSAVVDDVASAPAASNVSYDVTTYAKSNAAAIAFKNLTIPVGSESVSVSKINAANLTVKVEKKASELTHTKAIYGYTLDGTVNVDGTAYAATLDARNDLNTSKCNVRLTLKNFHSKDVTLVFAPTFDVNKEAEIAPDEGLGIAHFTRSFKKGWNTLCLPFETTVEKLGAAEADTISSVVTTDRKNGTATFVKVTSGVLKRGLPHLVYFNAATSVDFYFAGDVSDELIDGNGLIDGGLPFKFTGNYDGVISMYESYGLQGYAVGYGLVNGDDGSATIRIAGKGATLPSTCAFFGFEEDQSGNIGTSISLQFVDSEVTGINEAFTQSGGEVKPCAKGVYTLQGVKVSNGSTIGLPAGLYIVNGKKTMVR